MNILQIQEGVFHYFIYFDYIIVLMSIFAALFVLLAISRSSSSNYGYRYFIVSLTVSGLYMSLISILSFGFQVISNWSNITNNSLFKHPYFKCGANVLRTLRLAGFFTNLLSLCAISIDHFCNIMCPMKYRNFMTRGITKMIVLTIWLLSFSIALLDVPINIILYGDESVNNASLVDSHLPVTTVEMSPNSHFNAWEAAEITVDSAMDLNLLGIRRDLLFDEEDEKPDNLLNGTLDSEGDSSVEGMTTRNPMEVLNNMFKMLQEEEALRTNRDPCTFFSQSKIWFELCVIGLAIVSAILLIICYGAIIKKITESVHPAERGNKTLILTTISLIVAFIFCWMPFILFEFVMYLMFQYGEYTEESRETLIVRSFEIQGFLNSLLMTYPLVNSLIYAFRIPSIKKYFLQNFVLPFPCCRQCAQFLSHQNHESVMATAATGLNGNSNVFGEMAPVPLSSTMINNEEEPVNHPHRNTSDPVGKRLLHPNGTDNPLLHDSSNGYSTTDQSFL